MSKLLTSETFTTQFSKGKNSENRFTSLRVKGSRHFEATFVHFLNFLDAEGIN